MASQMRGRSVVGVGIGLVLCGVLASVLFVSAATARDRRYLLPTWDELGDLRERDPFYSPQSAPTVTWTPDTDRGNGMLPFYMGDHLRYPQANVVKRFFSSLVGTVANVAYWDEGDWLAAGLTVAGTLAFMAPTNPSPDARLQFWILERQTPGWNKVFPRLTTERYSAFGFGLIGSAALAGWTSGRRDLLEWSSLMLETLGVAQALHVAQKLLIGREGPVKGDGMGIVYGPEKGVEFWPSGTPSGHAMSTFALVALSMDYFDNVWIDVIGYTCYAYISVTLLYNNQHFISDVIWGAPMGYFIGKWISQHRSSRYSYRHGRPVRLDRSSVRFLGVVPWTHPDVGVGGLSATFAW